MIIKNTIFYSNIQKKNHMNQILIFAEMYKTSYFPQPLLTDYFRDTITLAILRVLNVKIELSDMEYDAINAGEWVCSCATVLCLCEREFLFYCLRLHYVCVSVCVCKCSSMPVFVCPSFWLCVRVYVCVCIFVLVCLCVHAHMCLSCTFVCVCVCIWHRTSMCKRL